MKFHKLNLLHLSYEHIYIAVKDTEKKVFTFTKNEWYCYFWILVFQIFIKFILRVAVVLGIFSRILQTYFLNYF